MGFSLLYIFHTSDIRFVWDSVYCIYFTPLTYVLQQTKGVHVAALANDTAGTLVAGCMDYEDCLCGLILGTGSNAAYTEKVANVPAMKGCTKENVCVFSNSIQ